MNRNVQLVLGGLAAVLFGLSALSRRFPEVAWLQAFRFENRLTEQQKARMRRRAQVNAGVEMILVGIALPMGYIIITVMFMNDFTPIATTLVLAGSVLLIGLGITAIARSRR